MEKIENVEDIFENIILPEPRYTAVYDPNSGSLHCIGPKSVLEHEKYTIDIDQETAEMIIEGRIKISSCFVDLIDNTFQIAEVKTAVKIDDVLHRIIEKQYADDEKIDLYIEYNIEEKSLTIELSEEYSGTYMQHEKFQPVKKKNITWSGDTEMRFFLTDYNDPNFIYDTISLKISDLIEKSKKITDLSLPSKFSVYTRRIFKNYLIDIK